MSENKYYWIKLKTNFFDESTIDWLQEQEHGCEYIVLYLRLCLLTANSGGHLRRQIGDMLIPYDIKKIAELTKINSDTVIVALEIFKKIGLVYCLENGELLIPIIPDIVGSYSQSKEAVKKRKYRKLIKKSVDRLGDKKGDKMSPQAVDKMSDRVKSIDIRVQSTEYRDRDRDRDITQEKDTTSVVSQKKTTKKFVKPTVEEVQAYINEKGYNIDSQYFIDYYESNGWKVGRNSMKDWKATVRNWARKGKTATIQAKVRADWEKDWSNEKDGWGED